jgi:RNA polymerase sigma-70 factor (ECF subfamily)
MSVRLPDAALALPGQGRRTPVQASASSLDFQATYDEFFDFVWRNLRRLGVHEDAIDDALQDVFIVVHRRSADYDERRASVRSWLFGIVLRVAKDHRRARLRKDPATRALVAVDPDTVAASPDLGPQERAEIAERIALLHRLLEELDENKRTLIILAELEQMTAPEMAHALEIPLNTIYSRLRTARLELQAALVRYRGTQGEDRGT